MNNTDQILLKIGLNKKERKIYLHLLQSGALSIQSISKATDIARATVYQRVESLKKIGLVDYALSEKGKLARAKPPETIKNILEKKIKKQENILEEYTKILPELKDQYTPNSSITKVMHFEGQSGIRRQILNYDMEAKDKDLYGYATVQMTEVVGNDFIMKKYHEKFYKKGYIDHYIMSDSKENQDFFKWVKQYKLYKENRIVVKKLPQKVFDPQVSVAIYDDKYSISRMKLGKPFGTIIQSQEIHDHQMEIFNILWKKAQLIS